MSRRNDARTCPFRKAKCYGCNRIGHLHKMCRNANTYFVGEEGSEFCGDGSGDGNDVSVITLGQRTPKYMVTVDVAGQTIGMELDTGAVVSVASDCLYREHLTHFALSKRSCNYEITKGVLPIKGVTKIPVRYQ